MTKRLMLIAVLMAGCGTDDDAPSPLDPLQCTFSTGAVRKVAGSCTVDLAGVDAAAFNGASPAYINDAGGVSTGNAEAYTWDLDDQRGLAIVLGEDFDDAAVVNDADRLCQWLRCQ